MRANGVSASRFPTQEKPQLVNQLLLDLLANEPVQTVAPIRCARHAR